MVLDDNNILQADATVIAGLLILLTIAYYLDKRSEQEIVGVFAEQTVKKISGLVIAVIIPFSISAFLISLENVLGSYIIPVSHSTLLANYGKYLMPINLGKYAMMVGFGSLAIGISWLLGSKATKRLSNKQRGTEKKQES
jgi:peptidoglycan biosynthesis protein MviN/MurJ (putative lipid II flippase)